MAFALAQSAPALFVRSSALKLKRDRAMDQPFVVFVELMFGLFALGLGWGAWVTRERKPARPQEREVTSPTMNRGASSRR
jgi:hypothetical protein